MSLPAPLHRCQLDGSRFARVNCTAASAAMALDAYTGGAIRVTPDAIRRAQPDQDGGISCDDAAIAWRRYGQRLVVSRPTWGALATRLRAGDGAIVQGDYGAVPDAYAVIDTFDGGHAVYAQSLRTLPSGVEVARVNDPLHPSGPLDWPATVLRAYYDGLPAGRAAWGEGTYAPPVKHTHRTVARVNIRTRPSLHPSTVALVARAGSFYRVEGIVGGPSYAFRGKRSDRWARLAAKGSGSNARRLDPPLYVAALALEAR